MSKEISIEPGLTCQFTNSCTNWAFSALIWELKIPLTLPLRWVMMPVCSQHIEAAKVLFAEKGSSSDNSVLGGGSHG